MVRYVPEVEVRGFYELVGDAFAYPLRGQAKWLLLVGAVSFTVASWFTWVPIMGWILAALILGYICAFMVKVVGHSARGDRHLPDWPDVTDAYDDIVRPLVLVVGTVFVTMLPAIVLGLGHLADGWRTVQAARIAFGVGLLYLPMALLGVCLTENFLMASPHVVIPAMLKVPVEYVTACAALAAVVALRWFGVPAVESQVSFFGGIVAEFLALYCLVFEMRVLGVLYYTRQRRLGWFT